MTVQQKPKPTPANDVRMVSSPPDPHKAKKPAAKPAQKKPAK
jgi:hypothetical protein